jgi:hypothetical protein
MRIGIVSLFLGTFCLGTATASQPAVRFDFTQGMQGWSPANQVENMRVTAEGLEFDCVGNDPYIISQPVDTMPLGSRVQLRIRMRSEADTRGEVFFGRAFSAQHSVRFTVRDDGQWHEYEVMLPPQEKGARLRIDPATSQGPVAIAYSPDPVSAAKAADEFSKENSKLVIIGAVMGEQVLDATGVEALAKLPSLDQLRGKIIGLIQAPATKVAGVIQAPASQLARVVSAYASKDAA